MIPGDIPETADRVSSRLLEAFGRLNDAALLLDPETGEILDCNEAAGRMFGAGREDLVGTPVFELHVDREAYERFVRLGDPALARAGVFLTEWTLRRSDGSAFPVEKTVMRVGDDPGLLISIVRDLTERIEAREAIDRTASRLRSIVENILDVVWVFDRGGVIRFVSPSVERSLGYGTDEIEGRHAFELVHPDDREPLAADLREALEAPKVAIRSSVRIRHADGTWRLHDGTGQRTSDTEPVEVVVVSRDVTERRQRQERLRAQEAMFRALTESSREIVAILDEEGRILYESAGYAGALGYDPEDRRGIDALEFIHPEDRAEVQRTFDTLRATPGYRVEGIEYRYEAADDSYRVLRSNARNMLDDPAVAGIVVTSLDVTERRRAEEALEESQRRLRHAQRMETVGQLAGGVAHDFNNVLTAIRGYAEILRGSFDPDDARHRAVAEIIDGADRAATLTRQLLAYSRQQVLRPAPLDLNRMVRALEDMLRRLIGEDLALEVEPDEDLETIVADRGQLEQVLVNLAVNARDAMPDGGTLRIETARVDLDEPLEHDHGRVPAGSWARLQVSDTGTGIPPDVMERIFEPFFTTKDEGEGTGLGLSTVYGIVEQSGGSIAVDSEPGEGTTFTVYLPVQPDAERDAAHFRMVGEPEGGRGERILVVEDDDAVRALAATVLRERGFEVLEAPTGQEALSILERATAPVDLIVADLVMPGMGGRELAREARERHGDRAVLYVSGYSERGPQGEEVHDVLSKPFTPDELVARVRRRLGEFDED